MKKIILISMYIILMVSGLIFMKYGQNTGSIVIEHGSILFSINLISLLGLFMYILSIMVFIVLEMRREH